MKKRKLLSILLTILITVTSSVSAFAASNEGSNLEKVIISVKNLITIPNDYSDFNYSYMEDSEENESIGIYTLEWHD